MNTRTYKGMHIAVSICLFAGGGMMAHAQTDVFWEGGNIGANWSDPDNWSINAVPNSNALEVKIGASSGSIHVDGNYTVKQIEKLYKNQAGGSTFLIDGPGTLTIDANSDGRGPDVIKNSSGSDRAGANGTVLEFTGQVVITNSGTALRPSFGFANNPANLIRFGTESTLTLNTEITVKYDAGRVELNGTLLGNKHLNIWAKNVTFGPGHDSSEFNAQFVFAQNSKLTIDGGIVGKGGEKMQFNRSDLVELELNAENAINDLNVRTKSPVFFTVNASQDDMGWLEIGNDDFTIDTVGGGLAFDNSSERNWGSGNLVISNFTAAAIRFGTDDSGLTDVQLSKISAYDSAGGPMKGLSLDSNGALIAEPATIGLIVSTGGGLEVEGQPAH